MAWGAPFTFAMNRPITIAGGGLAGLALANRLATEGLDVELYEKRRYPFHRVCGEFISGVSEAVLNELGLQHCFDDAETIRTMAWFKRDKQVLQQEMPRPALGISRYTLDERIAASARQSGVSVNEGEVFQGHDGEGIVWATGKSMSRQSRWIGLSAHFEDLDVEGLEMHCGPVGYIGLSAIEGGRVNVTGLFRKDAAMKGRVVELILAYLEANDCSELVRRLRESRYVEGSFAAIAGFEFGSQQSDGFRIGDRSLLIPPFAGNGMSMALEAAANASRILSEYSRGRLTWLDACAQQEQFQQSSFGLRMGVAARLHPLLLSSFGLRMLGALSSSGMLPTQRLFNALR